MSFVTICFVAFERYLALPDSSLNKGAFVMNESEVFLSQLAGQCQRYHA